jgi:hypothetical protein
VASESLLSRLDSIRQKNIADINLQIYTNNVKISQLQDLLINEKILNNINKINDTIATLNDLNNVLSAKDTSPSMFNVKQTHKFLIESEYKPFVSVGFEYSKNPISIKPTLGGNATFSIPTHGDFFSDMVVQIRMTGLEAINSANKVRYCDFLGHRLFSSVTLSSWGKVIDSYTTEDYNFHYQYSVPHDKRKSWKRCVGQEIPVKAYLTYDPNNQEFREYKKILNGNQTLKQTHDTVELFMPLLFWFRDPKLAVPNKLTPVSNLKIEIELASKNEIASCANYANDSGLFTTPIIEECILYVNHIFMDEAIVNIFLSKLGSSLIYTHSSSEFILNQPYGNISLDYISLPTTEILIVFRPIENLEGPNNSVNWHLNKKLTERLVEIPIMYNSAGTQLLGVNNVVYYDEDEVITSLSLSSESVDLYSKISTKFFNSYIPLQYGKIISPADDGSYHLNLSFEPNVYQPSSYLDIGNSKEVRLHYEGTTISSSNVVKAYISARTINFINYPDFALGYH